MKRISKITCFLALLTFTVACNDEVEIKEIYMYDLPSFNEIKQSTYSAKGTLYSIKAISWNGKIEPHDDEIVYEECQVKNAKLVLTPYASYSSPLKSIQSTVSETGRKSVSNTGSVNRSEVRSKRSKSVMKEPLKIQSRTSKSAQRLE